MAAQVRIAGGEVRALVGGVGSVNIQQEMLAAQKAQVEYLRRRAEAAERANILAEIALEMKAVQLKLTDDVKGELYQKLATYDAAAAAAEQDRIAQGSL